LQFSFFTVSLLIEINSFTKIFSFPTHHFMLNIFTKKSIVLVFTLIIGNASLTTAQVAYKYLGGFGTALQDINDAGTAVKSGGLYDFATDAHIPIDTNASIYYSINNKGDLLGSAPLLVDSVYIQQPAYRKNGIWYNTGFFPGVTVDGSASPYQISESSQYLTGQMTIDCCSQDAFLYNTATNVLEKIANPANEYSAAYTVNDAGIMGGWYDPQPVGTVRVPAYMTTGSVITNVNPAQPLSSGNQVSAINDNNVMVGDYENVPYIYNRNTNVFTSFNVPTGYETATFTSISNNGIAVGYAQRIAGNIVRDAIVYHPSLGSQPVLLRNVLASHGITNVETADGLLGTAIAISPDGNFICGWENGPFFFASGWVINFDNLLISDCYATCPTDISVTNLTGAVAVNYQTPSITCAPNPTATASLGGGFASGATFPVGTTAVTYNVVSSNGTVLNSCSFNVTVSDQYCDPSNANIWTTAITLVNIAGFSHATTDTSYVNYEDYTNIVGNMVRGNAYSGTFKGNTAGDFTDYFTIFIDWDKNGIFDPTTEKYDMGSITNSTGLDTISTTGTINVPTTAALGATTMRVVKNYDNASNTPCFIPSGIGQIEDYTLNISDAVSTTNATNTVFSCTPNPVHDILRLTSSVAMNHITVANVLGQVQIQTTLNATAAALDLSNLPAGTYFVTTRSANATKTVKVLKQ
jgi:GEVED domain/Secretion system C-terminal sorting domain/HYR domain